MATLYGICAVLGGTVMVCQLLLTLLGLGHHHDLPHGGLGGSGWDHDAPDVDVDADADGAGETDAHDTNWFFGVLTFRTVVAALTFFGLSGLAARSAGAAPLPGLAVALAAGVAAMLAVYWAMQQLDQLRTDGTVRTEDAVGQVATVYVKIQGHHRAAGKIHVNVHDRTIELQAQTDEDDIPTGTPVVVRRVLGPDTVLVERAPSSSEVSHV